MKTVQLWGLFWAGMLLTVGPSAAAADLSIKALFGRMEQAEAALKDVTLTKVMTTGSTEVVSRIWFRKPDRFLERDEQSSAQLLIRREPGGVTAITGYDPAMKILSQYESEDERPLVSFFGSLLQEMRDEVQEGMACTVTRDDSQEEPFYQVTLNDDQGFEVMYTVRAADWRVVKAQRMGGPVYQVEARDIQINTGLSEDLFYLNPSDDVHVLRNRLRGVEILQSGRVPPETMAEMLSSPAKPEEDHPVILEPGSEIPAALNTAFGVTFQGKGDITWGATMAELRWKHPPMVNPSTGETMTEHVAYTVMSFEQPAIALMTLQERWELVPGTWTLQIIEGTKVWAETTFEVVPAEKFLP